MLVVGLGNSSITPDALGPQVAQHILVTRHLTEELARSLGMGFLRKTAALIPGVLGQTGVESGELTAALVNFIQPSAVIVVDALAAQDYGRLGRTIQISDSGIAPGSGVQNSRKELSRRTLGIPVLSIGVPTVIDAATLADRQFMRAGASDGDGHPAGDRPADWTFCKIYRPCNQ